MNGYFIFYIFQFIREGVPSNNWLIIRGPPYKTLQKLNKLKTAKNGEG